MIWPYLAGGALLAGALAGWTVRDWKADADALQASQEAAQRLHEATQQGLDQGTAYARISAQNAAQAISERNTIREVYRDVPVSADCAVPAGAVGVLESARDRANAAATGEPRPTVPATPTVPDARSE